MPATARPQHPEERGATAVEYGLILSLIAGAIVLTVVAFGPQVNGLYTLATQGW